MPKLNETVKKAEWSALNGAVQEFYAPKTDDPETYELQHEGTSTLRESLDAKDRKLSEKDGEIGQLTTRLQALETQFKGIDVEVVRANAEKLRALDQGKLLTEKNYEAHLASEKGEWELARKAIEGDLASSDAALHQLIVDNRMQQILTSGVGADGTSKIPHVKPELLSGRVALFRSEHSPSVLRAGNKRSPVFDVDGSPVPMDPFLYRWLGSEAAKDWVSAPENSGSHDDVKLGGGGGGGDDKVIRIGESERSANIAGIAAGTHVVSDP